MQETYFLFNNELNIPFNIFLKEKQKYLDDTKNIIKKKRYLYNTFEGIVNENGLRTCYNKCLKNHNINENKLTIEWDIKEIEWPQDIEWHDTEEYLSEEFKTDNYIIEFITTKKGFRRILIKK
jgi:hypothetical protein